MTLAQFLFISIGGALGALARFGLGKLAQQMLTSGFPWGTIAVNLLGSLLFGVIWTLTDKYAATVPPHTRTLMLTGFMGAFTTFSTFMFDTATLLQEARWLAAFGNVSLQLALGLLAVFTGLAIGRAL